MFIPLVQIKHDPNWSIQEKALIKAELEEHEQAICELLTTVLDLSSVNIWLTPGTDERQGAPVCIDGVFYKSKAEAARALTDGKEETVYHRLETAKWSTWCKVSGTELLKCLRIMDSKGQRCGYKTFQYGEVLTINNTLVAKYWDTPKEKLL